jgi:putative molybdopterin biosynthesis protein
VGDLPAAQALDAWRAACAAAGCPDRVGTERLGLAASIGRVTAESLWARRSSPAFDSAGMDGIAVRAADTASASAAAPLTLTDFDLIDTGDPLSVQRDAVVMREHVRPVGQGAELVAAVAPYQHVRSIGMRSAPWVASPGSGRSSIPTR